MLNHRLPLVVALVVCVVGGWLVGQEPAKTPVGKADVGKVEPAMQARFAKFEKLLTGSKFQGSFTLDGKPLKDLNEETYEIEKVAKMPEEDLWSITARIKYGNKDYKVPVPIYVKWAGETPVLTMDKMTIPGYGTFSARVVLHVDKYAGTWQHDDKGGHLFGHIELAKP